MALTLGSAPRSDGGIAATDLSQHMVWRNAVSNIVLYASQVLLLLWYTRYLLQHFGPGIYGLVPLAATVTAYLGLLLISLNGAVGRFLAKDIAGGDVDSAQVTFSTALWGGAAVSAALLPAAALVAFGVPAIMNVPAGQEWPARMLFFAVLGSFLLLSAVNALSTVAFARNRLDLQNLVLGVQVVVRVAVSAALISGAGWALGAVSVGMLCAGLVGLAGAIAIWRLLAPELGPSWRRFSLPRLREMLRMGGWTLVNQGGALLFESSDIIIANLLWGAYAGGRYAAVVLLAATVRAAGAALASPLLPPIVHRFAQGRRDWVVDTARRGQRLLTLAVGLPVALVCGFSPVILVAWLGPGYRGLWPIAVALTVYLGVNIAMLPLFYVQVAANRLRLPGLVTLGSGSLSVALSVALGRPAAGIGMVGIALAPLVVLTLKNILFTPAYTAHLLETGWVQFLWPLAPGLIAQGVVTGVCALLVQLDAVRGWSGLVGWSVALSVLYAGICAVFVLTASDRTMLREALSPAKGSSPA